MNTKMKISRMKELIYRLEKGETVSNGSLSRVLSEEQMNGLVNDWIDEKASRKVIKPKAIVKYQSLVNTAIRLDGRAEKMCFTKSPAYKTRVMFHKADHAFENAIEFITEAIQNDGALRPWLDRDIKEASCSPIGIPRVIGSSSFECQNKEKVPFLTFTKRQLKIQALENALQELESGSVDTKKKVDILSKKPQKSLNFEGFRF